MSTTNYTIDLTTGLTQVLAYGYETYLYGLDRLGYGKNEGMYNFLPDALGSVRQVIKTSGENTGLTLAKSYDPYGNVIYSNGSDSMYGFTGEDQNNSAGLVYLRAKYYNASSGTFMSRDTWAGDENLPMSYNRWAYTYANPVNYTDPSGMYSSFTEGRLIHQMIQADYIASYGAGRSIVTEYYIRYASFSFPGDNYERADIADLTLEQIYEIKPKADETNGVAQLHNYLHYLPFGWSPGRIYSYEPIRIGVYPTDPTKDLYAFMKVTTPGVILYYSKKNGNEIPVPVFEYETKKEDEKNRNYYPQQLSPEAIPCFFVTVAVVSIILADPIPGDEILIPPALSVLTQVFSY